MDLQLEIVNAKSNKPLVTVYDVLDTFTVEELKKQIASKKPKYRDINRLELRLEPKGKPLKDEVTLRELGVKNESIVYFKVGYMFLLLISAISSCSLAQKVFNRRLKVYLCT